MSNYEKSCLSKDTVTRLNKYIERLKEIRKAEEKAEEKDSGSTEKTEGTEEA